MPLVSASLDVFLFTSLAISFPWLYYTTFRETLSIASPNHPPSPTPGPSPRLLRRFLNIFLLLHTLYILHSLLVAPPLNLFTRLRIPLSTPTDDIRNLLIAQAGTDTFPKSLETLLKRLGSFEIRTLYVRFGQTVIQTCEYCHTYDEYALFALPWPLLSYIRETAIVGLVTIKGTGPRSESLRTLGVGALVCAAVAEGYWTSTVAITVPKGNKSVVMWHDILTILRLLFFLVLTPLLHFLPSLMRPSPLQNTLSDLTLLQQTFQTLEQTTTRIHLLKYTRGAIMRIPKFRDRSGQWWAEEKREGSWVLHDENVQRVAEKEGFGFTSGAAENGGEGKLRTSARMAIESLKMGFRPSDHWKTS